MNTPILDFVRAYAESNSMRLHMPGHKGTPLLGFEAFDITEVVGADSLYEADGIIRESEKNASALFGCPTYYSTEGSSQCIRAMLYLTLLYAKERGVDRPLILAGRNAHKTFLSAAALLDLDVDWLYPTEGWYLSCDISPVRLDAVLSSYEIKPAAVYLTSPDYLGNVLDIKRLSDVCRKHGVLLLVDNAHGAYLKFLSPSLHPMDLGADICCDSAHKTLPVLTGGAYLHIGTHLPLDLRSQVKQALALFGSTSPSYLILQSLDMVNAVLASKDFAPSLMKTAKRVEACRVKLMAHGINAMQGDEPLKLTLYPRLFGYTGLEIARHLRDHGIECEFADPDYLVMMITPAITELDLERMTDVLLSLPRREALALCPPALTHPKRAMTIREAMLSPSETLPVSECIGRVLAAATVGCPPAVPIVVSGEQISESAAVCFQYYGIKVCSVIKN
ncbi:MAG: amino acid decarboxylase [Ruminococcaceae bacterium]|nr:amino acid decarboxylase [Oscillospiraceae bacterium]